MKTLEEIKNEKLLLKALSVMLPYKLYIHFEYDSYSTTIDEDRFLDFEDIETLKYNTEHPESDGYARISWKPYLRSMEDMTEEEIVELNNIPSTKNYQIVKGDLPWAIANYKQLDWLLEHHFNIFLPENLYIKVSKENNPYDESVRIEWLNSTKLLRDL